MVYSHGAQADSSAHPATLCQDRLHVRLSRDFVQALIACDAGLTDNDYAALDDMATSIQW